MSRLGATCLLLAIAAPVLALDLDVRARVDATNWLIADLHAEGILDEDLLLAVRSGLPARFRWKVEVWRDRRGVWDTLAASAETELQLLYDALEEEYRILDGSGRAIAHTPDVEEVAELLGREQLELLPIEELSDSGHYIVAQLSIRPLTLQEVRDLERWLRGSMREGGGIPSQLLGVVQQRLGLGDRKEVERSPIFRPRQLGETP